MSTTRKQIKYAEIRTIISKVFAIISKFRELKCVEFINLHSSDLKVINGL